MSGLNSNNRVGRPRRSRPLNGVLRDLVVDRFAGGASVEALSIQTGLDGRTVESVIRSAFKSKRYSGW